MKLASFVTGVAPLNAMPFDEKLKQLEFAAKVGKYIPHPMVQKASYIADAAIQTTKTVKKKVIPRIKKHLDSVLEDRPH